MVSRLAKNRIKRDLFIRFCAQNPSTQSSICLVPHPIGPWSTFSELQGGWDRSSAARLVDPRTLGRKRTSVAVQKNREIGDILDRFIASRAIRMSSSVTFCSTAFVRPFRDGSARNESGKKILVPTVISVASLRR
jgi:hypothetical protein